MSRYSLRGDHGMGMLPSRGGTFHPLCTAGRAAIAAYQRLTLIIIKGDGLPFEPGNPRPNGDVGDRIVARRIFGLAEPPIEHTPEPPCFLGVALLGISALSRIEFHEMVNLTEEGTWATHLPYQPLDHAPFGGKILRPKLAGL